jgi:lysophospholipase L1-like esterase
MNKEKISSAFIVVLMLSAIATFFILAYQNEKARSEALHVACVGDCLTQSSGYPAYLWNLLGTTHYTVGNFGVGSTTVLLNTDTPYMNTSAFKSALDFNPDIVVIMLGTNDAQPNLKEYNASFVGDYVTLIKAFQALKSNPQIWVVLPPPIFSDQSGKLDPDYFSSFLISSISQAASETHVQVIDVYSALANYSSYFPDGEHPNMAAAKLMADAIYDAIT